ncbi:MAG: DUF4258 domain-containing protein [Ktedonobacterales bacterium]
MASYALFFSGHARQRMTERQISVANVRSEGDSGEPVEDYPHDTPLRSRILLGWADSRPLHVVAAHDPAANRTIIVTVYEPDPMLWEVDFKASKP